ncbi:hypothetical protein ACVI53_009145 [Bradyrhizobium barranii subsp. barranii]
MTDLFLGPDEGLGRTYIVEPGDRRIIEEID